MVGTPQPLDLGRADAYGWSFGDVYDRWYEGVTDAEATADFVAARHRRWDRPVLELGVGTGRLAAPLAGRGLRVVGLDGSAAMLAGCRRRPGAERVRLVRADMRALPFRSGPRPGREVDRPFGSVLLGFNTLFNLTTVDDQQRLLSELAAVVDDGVVVVEMLDVGPLVDGPDRSIGRRGHSTDPVVVTATALDRDGQRLWGQHVEVTDDGLLLRPWMLRWVTPDQLDAMAEAAGLARTERYGSWDGAPAAGDSATVISVYRASGP